MRRSLHAIRISGHARGRVPPALRHLHGTRCLPRHGRGRRGAALGAAAVLVLERRSRGGRDGGRRCVGDGDAVVHPRRLRRRPRSQSSRVARRRRRRGAARQRLHTHRSADRDRHCGPGHEEDRRRGRRRALERRHHRTRRAPRHAGRDARPARGATVRRHGDERGGGGAALRCVQQRRVGLSRAGCHRARSAGARVARADGAGGAGTRADRARASRVLERGTAAGGGHAALRHAPRRCRRASAGPSERARLRGRSGRRGAVRQRERGRLRRISRRPVARIPEAGPRGRQRCRVAGGDAPGAPLPAGGGRHRARRRGHGLQRRARDLCLARRSLAQRRPFRRHRHPRAVRDAHRRLLCRRGHDGRGTGDDLGGRQRLVRHACVTPGVAAFSMRAGTVDALLTTRDGGLFVAQRPPARRRAVR